jgi:glycine/sarcosine N-methyltransferase
MYDGFSVDYDRFVNWPKRLSFELPFIEQQLHSVGGTGIAVLDAACGTGWHAITLAQRGYQAAGADLSQGMIEVARHNAARAGVTVRFDPVGFGKLAQTFGEGAFEAVLCLGNSLPHLLTPSDLAEALVDFAACLKPGGLLLIQNRNFDAALLSRIRWMEPQAHQEDQAQWIFLRFYDFDPDGLITFNILSLQRVGQGAWTQTVNTTRLRPWLRRELEDCLHSIEFRRIGVYGSLGGEAYDPLGSGNLVMAARRI